METFAFAAQLISTISVIVSLVYLAYQIHENTRSMRRAASRDIVRELNEFGRMFVELPDLNELYLKAIEQPQELTAAERFRFERLITYACTSFETALDYHADGLVGGETIEAYG